MIDYQILKPASTVGLVEKNSIVDFLYNHLDQFGDPKEHIGAAIEYALNFGVTPGGFVVVARDVARVVGTVVVNKTGMKGYIPENILVYIATHSDYRGKGIGKKLMEMTIATADGAIALHVEADNPACKLYQKMGFTNKYLEMRLNR